MHRLIVLVVLQVLIPSCGTQDALLIVEGTAPDNGTCSVVALEESSQKPVGERRVSGDFSESFHLSGLLPALGSYTIALLCSGQERAKAEHVYANSKMPVRLGANAP